MTTVADASALTAEEISNVTEAIKGVNPTATDVKVSKDGSAVVTFKDGSSATLSASQTVKVKAEATSKLLHVHVVPFLQKMQSAHVL